MSETETNETPSQEATTTTTSTAIMEHLSSKKRRRKHNKKDMKSSKKKKRRSDEELSSTSLLVSEKVAVSSNDETKSKNKKKKKARRRSSDEDDTKHDEHPRDSNITTTTMQVVNGDGNIIQTSALDFVQPLQHHPAESPNTNTTTSSSSSSQQHHPEQANNNKDDDTDVTLLLFYQYVEPPWETPVYHKALEHMQHLGDTLHLTGRMRVAKEGLNCTLTGTNRHIVDFCKALRQQTEFANTEFKLTKDLPQRQSFPNLKVMPVAELVHYGLEGEKAPSIAAYTGDHLQPEDYHVKLAENETVVIDVRNHYEAAIGHFHPPTDGAQWLDPKMRKSTEFPLWLDKNSTKEQLRGKQVLMYCTGGVRCERASALLKYKMETDPDIKDLDIKGVFQLQGGIDKYFKQFPDGGYWKGKNYTFDKRFAHAPPKVEGVLRSKEKKKEAKTEIMGKCEACAKPWDMYRGKRRCPACGVPSLICRACFEADKSGTRKLDRSVRCELCVAENVTSKGQLKKREQKEIEQYEKNMTEKGVTIERKQVDKNSRPQFYKPATNPDGVTRLLLKNMCRKNMDEPTLIEAVPGITHIVWRTDRQTGQFFGSGWVEMATPADAARAVGMNGKRVLGRPLYISYQPPDGKDAWPPANSAVTTSY